jgi:hypothetical protein
MTSAAVRDSIGEALRLDLVGPAPEDAAHAREVLPRPPSRWYLTGWLVPEGSTEPLELEAEEDLDAGAEDPTGDDTAPEEKLAARVRLLPSSIGLSCLLRAGTERVRVRLDWGEYEPAEEKAESSETALVPVEDPSVETVVVEGEEAGGPTHWRRRPVMRELELSLGDEGGSLPPAEGVELRWLVRRVPQGEREALLLTLFLTNRRAETRPRDLAFLFQPRIEVESDALVGRTDARVGRADDLDSRIAALHYREVREWAVGHGIGAEPVVEPDGSVRRVRTTWMPTTEVARVEARGEVPGERAAERLGRLEAGEVEAALGPLARAYRAWIEEQRRAIATLPEAHRATAEELVAGAERAAERRGERRRPARHDALDGVVALEAHAIRHGVAGDVAQRLHHLADAHAQARHVDRARVAERRRRQLVRQDQVLDRATRREQPDAQARLNRTDRLDAVQRLANDAAQE